MSKRYDLIGYCSYRDNETGKVSDNFVGVLNEQDQKIKDLEAELAESEKDLEIVCVEGKDKIREYAEITNSQQEEIFKLKQQLVEEKNRNKKLNHEAQKYYEDAYCNGSQNQKAIAELNNILDTFAIFVNEEKESMVSPDGNGNLSLLEYVENRIDTLKGEK